MTVASFIDPGWTFAVAATNRPDLRILFYPDGTRRFWHTCTVPNPDPAVIAKYGEDVATIECSPVLQHDVKLWNGEGPPVVSVSPSILCHRCKLHGFFTANQWSDA